MCIFRVFQTTYIFKTMLFFVCFPLEFCGQLCLIVDKWAFLLWITPTYLQFQDLLWEPEIASFFDIFALVQYCF